MKSKHNKENLFVSFIWIMKINENNARIEVIHSVVAQEPGGLVQRAWEYSPP